MDRHFQANWSKLTGQECITRLITGIWDHVDRVWMYHKNRYEENTNQQVYEEIREKYAGLVERLQAFQMKHLEDR
jgi:hypothetical protein